MQFVQFGGIFGSILGGILGVAIISNISNVQCGGIVAIRGDLGKWGNILFRLSLYPPI